MTCHAVLHVVSVTGVDPEQSPHQNALVRGLLCGTDEALFDLGELAVPCRAHWVGVGKQDIEAIVGDLDDFAEDGPVLVFRRIC